MYNLHRKAYIHVFLGKQLLFNVSQTYNLTISSLMFSLCTKSTKFQKVNLFFKGNMTL